MKNDFAKLVEVVAALRGPNGCPWDKKQTLYSLKDDFIEEAYELVASIENKDISNMTEELGDVLLHVVIHSQIASEDGLFSVDDVTDGIVKKLIRRHPHVFASEDIKEPEAVLARWEEIKIAEKGREQKKHYLDKAAKPLPALLQAEKLKNAARKVGYDWDGPEAVFDKLAEEVDELHEAFATGDKDKMKDELGDVLFVLVNLASHLGFNAEDALKSTNQKFVRRFNFVEDALDNKGKKLADASLEEMEEQWQKAKKLEKMG